MQDCLGGQDREEREECQGVPGLAGSCTWTMAVGPGGDYRDGEVGKNGLNEGFQTEPLKGLWWSWGRGGN